MDTDVYFLCPNCKCITEGKGTGDSLDLITCNKCNNEFKASRNIGIYKEYGKTYEMGPLTHSERPLYIPVEIKILQ